MPEFTFVVTQRVRHYIPEEFDTPQEVIELVETGDYDGGGTEVLSDRVQVYDEDGLLVADTDPGDCEACGRADHAGFRDGQPYCHRHLEA